MAKQKRRKMEKEEIKRRVAAGIENRRKKGLLRPITKPITTHAVGPTLTKKQRQQVIGHITIATAALCNTDKEDYVGAATSVWKIMHGAGYTNQVLQEILIGVAVEAAELTGDDFKILDNIARAWLFDAFRERDSAILMPGKGIN